MMQNHPARVVRIADIGEQPWKNGAGTTRVIAAGAGWRISLATVGSNGAFSVFDSTRRHSVVVKGGGITLRAEEFAVTLSPHAVVQYRGDVEWECWLQANPATVLNVMCEEHRAEAVIEQADRLHISAVRCPVAVFPVNCSAMCVADGVNVPTIVPRGHVLLCEDPEVEWACTSDARPATPGAYLLAIRIHPIASSQTVFHD